MLTHGSLFSGIGGFDLASEWMGWKNVFHCEYDPFCQKVLKHHFPNSKLYKDVRKFDATNYLGRVDILTGGFPCQPFSNAGLRKGTEDERHLWPSMLRIIREVSPRYVVGENVRGLLNWSGGLVFEEVCADLENEGYEVTPYLLPACGKNAPHRRDRIWFVAYRDNGLCQQPNEELCTRGNAFNSSGKRFTPDTDSGGLEGTTKERRDGFNVEWEGEFGDAPDTEHIRLEHGTNPEEVGGGQGEMEKEGGEFTEPIEANGESRTATDTFSARCDGERKFIKPTTQKRISDSCDTWENFPTVPPVCGGDDGLPKELDGITFPKWRRQSVAAYGNAIVPQIAHSIFEAIDIMDREFNALDVN